MNKLKSLFVFTFFISSVFSANVFQTATMREIDTVVNLIINTNDIYHKNIAEDKKMPADVKSFLKEKIRDKIHFSTKR